MRTTTTDDRSYSLALIIALMVLGVVLIASLLPNLTFFQNRVGESDASSDWMMTRAALSQDDPYRNWADLARDYGLPFAPPVPDTAKETGVTSYRTPGAYLLLLPLLLAPWRFAYLIMNILNVGLLFLLGMTIARSAGWRRDRALVLSPLLLLTGPILQNFRWGQVSLLVSILLVVAWFRLRKGDDAWAGVAIAVAAVMKLYPLLLVVPMLFYRKTRAVAWMAATFIGLNVAGFALFRGITLRSSITGMQESSKVWGLSHGNISFAGLLTRTHISWNAAFTIGTLLALAALVVMWIRSRSFDGRFTGTVIVALMMSPLSWRHYDSVLMPIGAWIFATAPKEWKVRTALGLWFAFDVFGWIIWGLLPTGEHVNGVTLLNFVGRIALLLALLLRERSVTAPAQEAST